ncbi:hypothetical protein SAMN04488556_2716 [Halostagnicola kamekurae]|uniref:Uncharacterized protein n=1 Tax=Halostagnicola kamekurae TaxID=619731 RepID=A0A1I6SJ69_9EURY|nr:hypothetical protein SAMN04488556_2716 [Halostagnicola kamekurae]
MQRRMSVFLAVVRVCETLMAEPAWLYPSSVPE